MALFPITGRFKGDFVPHLVPVDTDDTMDQVATKVAHHSVGRRLPDEGKGLEVSIDGEVIDPSRRLGELDLMPLQWVDVGWRQ